MLDSTLVKMFDPGSSPDIEVVRLATVKETHHFHTHYVSFPRSFDDFYCERVEIFKDTCSEWRLQRNCRDIIFIIAWPPRYLHNLAAQPDTRENRLSHKYHLDSSNFSFSSSANFLISQLSLWTYLYSRLPSRFSFMSSYSWANNYQLILCRKSPLCYKNSL